MSKSIEIQVDQEDQVKAGYLYKFLFFADWPEKKNGTGEDTVILGILGDTKIYRLFTDVEGRTVDGKKLIVKRFTGNRSTDHLHRCHVLFFGRSATQDLTDYLGVIRDVSILTVGETDGFVDKGGIIGFTTKRNRISFEVNKKAAKHAGIQLRSQLLRLADRIIEE